MADELTPLRLRRDGDGLRIDWVDGTSTRATWRALRAACPCATCTDERQKPPNPFRVLTPAEAAAGPPDAVGMAPVGHYAYQITWNDGHGAGIYTLAQLRTLSAP
jgi:DUF971 family protein